MSKNKHITATLFFVAITIIHAAAQTTNTSPYSIIGIGDINDNPVDRSAGMASASTSLSSNRAMYISNPASLATLDEHFFSVELSAQYKRVNYFGNSVSIDNNHSDDLQVTRFSAGIKVKPFWGAAIGITPYSSSNYSFYNNKSILGTTEVTNAHEYGTGGLNRFYFSNGFKITKSFSLGVDVSYLFGSLMQNETLNTDLATDSIVTTRDLFLNKLVVKAGFQYRIKLSKNVKFNIGAIASPQQNLNANYSLTVKQGATTLINNRTINESYFKLPVSYTAGASLVYKDKITLAADYQAQQWSNTNYTGLGYALTNSNRLAVGLQYSQLAKYYNYTYEKYYLQAGTYYTNTYLVVNGYQLRDYGLTAGVGVNSKKSSLGYQLNLQVGTRGTTNNGLLKENYTQASFTIFYRDFWRTKAKIYD